MGDDVNIEQKFLKHWQKFTSRPMTTREVEFAKAIRNEAMEEAAQCMEEQDTQAPKHNASAIRNLKDAK